MEDIIIPTSTENAGDTARPQGSNQRSNSEKSNFRTTGSNSSGSSGYGGKPTSSSPATAQKDTKPSLCTRTIEDSASTTSIANDVDSAYSQNNSRSLSSESSQCRMRGSNSSGSNGYGGKQTTSLLQAQAENRCAISTSRFDHRTKSHSQFPNKRTGVMLEIVIAIKNNICGHPFNILEVLAIKHIILNSH